MAGGQQDEPHDGAPTQLQGATSLRPMLHHHACTQLPACSVQQHLLSRPASRSSSAAEPHLLCNRASASINFDRMPQAFAAVMGFWLLHLFSIRILNRNKKVTSPRALAELQHG